MGIIDVIVIIAYFAIVIWIGFRAMKHIKSQEDFFLGGRRFGKIVQIFTMFGQATNTDTAVSASTTTFSNGASGVWAQLAILFATPFYWITARWYRRFRFLSMGEFFEERYGSKNMASFYAVVSTILIISSIGLGMKAMAVTVQGIAQKKEVQLTQVERTEYNKANELEKLKEVRNMGLLTEGQKERLAILELENPQQFFSNLNEITIIFFAFIIILIYAIAGGLEAAMYTDTLQGVFIILLSVLMIPFGLYKLYDAYNATSIMHTFQLMHDKMPSWYFEFFGSPFAMDFTWYYIVAIAVMSIINVHIQSNQLSAMGSAKDELTAKVGCVVGSFMKRFCIILWCFTGIISVALYYGVINNPDIVWGYTVNDLLGPLGIGLVGLMIACLMSALMSTADMFMITGSGLLTRNVYRYYLPNYSEKHYVFMGRVFGASILIAGCLFATCFDSILQMLKFVWEFNSILAAAFWAGMLWKRSNIKAAWASMLVACLLFTLLPAALPAIFPNLTKSESLVKQTKSVPVSKMYDVTENDIKYSKNMHQIWGNMPSSEKTVHKEPKIVKVGEQLEKKVVQPPRAIYWSKGIKINSNGEKYGTGMLYLDMVAIGSIFDLSKNSYAFNETIRTWIRIILPFLVILLVSLATKADNKKMIDKFYVKMRTPVIVDKELDRIEMEKSYSNPDRYSEKRMFPNSDIMCLKWTKNDFWGFTLSVGGVFFILGFLWFVLNIGTF